MATTRGKIVDVKTLISFERNGKQICIFLKNGESISLENIVDVFVCDQPERSKREDQRCSFCLNPESILTPETCCTGCGALNTVETQ
jgi:hypothetical protein